MRFLLQRVDFGCAEEKDAKKAKTTKEAAAQAASKWPWQELVENLQMAQQELSYILDFITHVRITLQGSALVWVFILVCRSPRYDTFSAIISWSYLAI